jgi:hypothetical protein
MTSQPHASERKRGRFFFQDGLHSAHADGRRAAAQIWRFAWTNLQRKRQKTKATSGWMSNAGQVVFVLERSYGMGLVIATTGGRSGLVMIRFEGRFQWLRLRPNQVTKADPSSFFQLHTVTVNSSTLIKIRPQRRFIFDFSPGFFLQSFRNQERVKLKVVNGFCPKIAPIRHRFIRHELSGLLIEESK